jgi:hypothetical protein
MLHYSVPVIPKLAMTAIRSCAGTGMVKGCKMLQIVKRGHTWNMTRDEYAENEGHHAKDDQFPEDKELSKLGKRIFTRKCPCAWSFPDTCRGCNQSGSHSTTTNYSDEPYDYGFDLPDRRDEYIDQTDESITITIVRHWESDDGGERVSFKCSFNITRANETTYLPIGIDESKAREIARLMYPEDEVASQDVYETRAIELAEMRMGA